MLDAGGDDPAVRQVLAVLLLQSERPGAAAELLEGLVSGPAPPPGSDLLLATACRTLGRIARGLGLIDAILAAHPRDAAAWALAGSLRTLAGDPAAGEAALRRALHFDPRHAESTNWLAIALHRQQRWQEAIELYRRVLAATPRDATARYNLALALEQAGEWEAARAELERVVAERPARLDARARLANVQALLCDFDGEAASVRALDALLAAPAALEPDDQLEPFVLTFLPLSPDAAEAALARYVRKIAAEAQALPPVRPPVRAPSRPLRLGYLSADFGNHAVGGLLRDHFAAHDRRRVSVHGYSLRRHADDTARVLRAGFDDFLDAEALSTAALAQRIADDGIDVLVDLSGYTLAARPAVLALRPAPVQLGWLGFIHDYGAPWIDGLLLDATLAPDPGRFRSKVLTLPGTCLPAARRTPFAPARRADFDLPAGVPLLASFNNSYKLDAALLDAWRAIAASVPDARFVVYVPDAARPGLAREWSRRGGAADALHFVPKLEPAAHLARSACCDLFLDAFRYQAGATAVAAIEAGLPVLSLPGTTPLARLGASLARALGMEELLAPDAADWAARAAALAGDPARLRETREKLAEAIEISGLFDPSRSARAIEDAITL